MSKYSLEAPAQKPFKQGLKTPLIELQGQVDTKTNYITGFTLVLKGKGKEQRKLIKVNKGKLINSYSEIKEVVKGAQKKFGKPSK